MERVRMRATTSYGAAARGSGASRRPRVLARAEPNRAPPRQDELRDQYDGYEDPPRRYPREEYSPGGAGYQGGPPPPPPPKNRGGWLDSLGGSPVNSALLAGVFVLGIGAGVALDTEVSLNRDNVASIDMVDRLTPNSAACAAYGSSAVVFDQRIFMSFNPFNVYVTQPEVKPGCVLRKSNWSVLERRKLVDNEQVADCKRHMNTFAFVGDLEGSPEVNCVYHSENAENQYLQDPSSAALGDGEQVRRNKSVQQQQQFR